MAILARPRHALPRLPHESVAAVPDVEADSRLRARVGNAIPFLISVTLASLVFWTPFYSMTAWAFAIGMFAFFTYWLFRSYGVAAACLIGLRRLSAWRRTDWAQKYEAWRAVRPFSAAWDWPRHMVVIPNYKEEEHGLRRMLDSLAAQANASQLVVVLAMEAREDAAEGKAARLLLAYRERFGDLFATFHPSGIPGEAPGKGSNEAWGVREAYRRLIEEEGDELARYSVTSCDADAVFAPHHFSALNYLFLTEPDRYRSFWQPAIFNSNNIWEVPAPLRILDGLSGINRLANMTLPGSVKFPTSCYTTSWQLLHEIDYWDEEVIPEDWHVYLKSCYALGDRVHVTSMYVALGNDCVLTDSYWKTLKAHYFQAVRHAWGASDIPYAWRATWRGGPLSRARALLLAATVTKVHVLWVAQWYLVTLGILLPAQFAKHLGAPMPDFWTDRGYRLPGPTWHLHLLDTPSAWFGSPGLLDATMRVNAPGVLIALCIIPLFLMIGIEYRQRGPRPSYVSRWAAVRSVLMWPLMAPITFMWASMPAFHAQLRLASGRGLIYRVAEKGTRAVFQAQAVAAAEATRPTPSVVGAEPAEPARNLN